MSHFLIKIILLSFILSIVFTQCTAYCGSCGANPLQCTFSNNSSCPSNFTYAGPVCYASTYRYNTSTQINNTNILPYMSNQNTMPCSPSFPQNLFGSYNHLTSITILNAIGNLPSHIYIRIRTSVVWIDDWSPGSTFTIYIDGYNITSKTYNPIINTVVSNPSCNTTSSGIVYSILDTN